MHTMSASWI